MEYEKHGTYHTASFAQCCRDDNLRFIFQIIHVLIMIFDEPENRRFCEEWTIQSHHRLAWAEIKDINWRQCWLTKIAAKLRKGPVSYASRTTKLRTQVSSSSTEQSRAAEWSYFCSRKSAGPVRHFEIGVQCASENLAWRHFTSQRLPT